MIEKGIITAIVCNRSHTITKFRVGVKKWMFYRTQSDMTDMLGATCEFTGTWQNNQQGKYFLIENLDIVRRPKETIVMEKVLAFCAKEGITISPVRIELNPLFRKTITTIYVMGYRQVLAKYLKLKEEKQGQYLSNPFLFYHKRFLDFYSAATLSLITCTPLDVKSRVIAHAAHVVTIAHESGKECTTLSAVAAEISRRINIPESDAVDILSHASEKGETPGVKRESDTLMLEWIYWLREKSIKMMFDNPLVNVPPEIEDENLSQLLSRKISVLSGGAGTGKTTLLKKLRGTGLRVQYAAMTGKAASLLGEGACTIHSLLGYRGGKFTVKSLDCDLLVVDEISMVGWHVLYSILKAAPRVIFSGDPEQLPPIEGDVVYRRMLTILPKVELTKSWRYKGGEGPNVKEIHFQDSGTLLAAVRSTAARLAKQGTMQVITPINCGIMGVGNLNAMLRPIINPTQSQPLVGRFYLHDRVICRRNVYCDGIILAANGQVGTVTGREGGMLWVNINGNNILLDADDLHYAYAQSVHRAQGSEYDNVIFIVPDKLDQEFLTDNLLLVGKTRGKVKTYVFSLEDAMPNDQDTTTRH